MADGGWPKATGEARTLAAIEQLRTMLGVLEARLAAGEPARLSADAAVDLIHTLDTLARRVADHEAAARRRADELAADVRRLNQRLEAQAAAQAARESALAVRLDLMLGELGRRRETDGPAAPAKGPDMSSLVLVAASAIAALSVVGAGVLVGTRPQILPAFVAAVLDDLSLRGALGTRPPTPAPSRPAPSQPTAAPRATATVEAETYAAIAAAVARGDATALARLTGLAQAGVAEAQLHLASLYETGGGGLGRDIAASRLWTGRAAEGGDRMAMHNLALFLMQGEGGPRDVTAAAGWFHAAATRGVIDSQYNLGLLYEAGRGVPQNAREAYRWFSIAANAGDVAAREKQVEIEALLQPAERARLDREARAFRPDDPAPDPAQLIAPAASVAETQARLARQGYYVGPIDGVASPAFQAAAAAWKRDHP